MTYQDLNLTDQELFQLRVFNVIRKSDSRRRFYGHTILFDNVTVEQAIPQLEQLAVIGIITQQRRFDEYREGYFTIEITKNPTDAVALLIERQCALCRRHFGEY